MTHAEEWTVGDQVFVVADDRRSNIRSEYKPITKIGRKWITVGEGWQACRFDAETLRLDGGQYSSPGRVWPNEDEYRDSLASQKAWSDMIRRLPHRPPPHLTVEDIDEMARAIFGSEVTP